MQKTHSWNWSTLLRVCKSLVGMSIAVLVSSCQGFAQSPFLVADTDKVKSSAPGTSDIRIAEDLKRAKQLDDEGAQASEKNNFQYACSRAAEALATYERILKVAPENIDALKGKGADLAYLARTTSNTRLLELEKLNEALTCYNRVLKSSPRDSDSLEEKGIIVYRLSLLHFVGEEKQSKAYAREAVETLKRALKLNPNCKTCADYLREAEDLQAGRTPKRLTDTMHKIEMQLQQKD